ASEQLILGRSNGHETVRPYRAPADGGEAKALPFGIGGSNIAWSRKGNVLAFSSAVRVQALYRVPIPIQPGATPHAERWISSRFTENSPSFSPDGRFVLFGSDRSGSYQIYRADADGNGVSQLTNLFGYTVGSPVWSPDSRLILFDARVDGNPDIWLMNPDGTKMRRL